MRAGAVRYQRTLLSRGPARLSLWAKTGSRTLWAPRVNPGIADVGAKTLANKVTGGMPIEGTSPRAEPCWGSADVGAKTPAGEEAAASQPASEARGEAPTDAAETARRKHVELQHKCSFPRSYWHRARG